MGKLMIGIGALSGALLPAILLSASQLSCSGEPVREIVVRRHEATGAASGSAAGAEMSPVLLPEIPKTLTFAGEEVPMEYFDVREALQRELITMCYQHSSTVQIILRSGRYFPEIDRILKEEGIPYDFRYLCVAESALLESAVSSASAAGLWQFMSATARANGLVVDSGVDERYNVEKATRSACAFLRDLHSELGSWTLAAAGYNAGQAGVRKRVEAQRQTSYYDMTLPQETMRYLFRILSYKCLFEMGPETYGFRIPKKSIYRPLSDFKTVTVSDRKIDWVSLAASYGTSYRMLRLLNNWIRDYTYDNVKGYTFSVLIPERGFREQFGQE